jgi:hypothetical protein
MFLTPIIHLNYKVNKIKLLEEANIAKIFAKGYTDSRYPELKLEDWLIGHYTSDYIQEIMYDLEINGKPRFYWLLPNSVIPEHVDNGTQCSVNIVLTDYAAPISINGTDYEYQTILLNTTIPHSVKNNKYERIMLKISIFDETFNEVASRIKYKQ